MKFDLRKFSAFLLVAVVAMQITGLMLSTMAAPSSTFTIAGGIYPGAPSYTVWKEGTIYYAKNANGLLTAESTNATAVIQSVFDATPNTVFFRKADYATKTLSVPSNVELIAEKGTTFTSSTYVYYLFDIASKSNIKIKGFSFLNNNNLVNYTINIYGSSNIKIEDCSYDGYGSANISSSRNIFVFMNALAADPNIDITVDQAYVYQGGNKGVELGAIHLMFYTYGFKLLDSTFIDSKAGNVVVGDSNKDILISGNYMDTSAVDCDGVDIINASLVVISDNVILNMGAVGISIERISAGQMVSKVSITGNVVSRSGGSGIVIGRASYNVSDIVVSGNVLSNNGKALPGNPYEASGILIQDAFNVVVTGNRLLDDETSTQNWGIYERGTSDYNMIIGNDARNNVVSGIKKSGANTKVNLSWNGTTWIA